MLGTIHGTKNILASLRHARPGRRLHAAALLEPGAHAAAARFLLVGGLSQRMVQLTSWRNSAWLQEGILLQRRSLSGRGHNQYGIHRAALKRFRSVKH